MPRIVNLTCFLVACFVYCNAFRPNLRHRVSFSSTRCCLSVSMNSDDMGVSLAELQDFEQDGAHISESVMNFLDKEWIKQDIHRQLGEKCKEVYIKGRKEGVLDLGDMLIALGSALEVFDMKDAYVGAWDVANTVSDLLMVRLQREMCECSADVIAFSEAQGAQVQYNKRDSEDIEDNKDNTSVFLVTPLPTVSASGVELPALPDTAVANLNLADAARGLSAQFSRYRLLKDLLEGELDLSSQHRNDGNNDSNDSLSGGGETSLHAALALVLGFRETDSSTTSNSNSNEGGIRQEEGCAAHGWEGLHAMPDLTILQGPLANNVSDRLQADIPADAELTDVAIEPLVGLEMYKIIKQGGRPEDVRRVLLAKWLYVHGFITQHAFPPAPGEVFLPRNLIETDEEDGFSDFSSNAEY